ncbi:MAG TPA: N-acetylmuramoyl-L-alanine amidase [Gemmatimonadales bacterium]|jgi:N-acetylmuramoyl-L-alanine amidase|nr:N-acetylmuramoyl-L-alanine amidase [Gemmatimonadales bacterium]
MMVLLLLAGLVPQQVLIATPRGQVSIPVTSERGAAAVAGMLLAQPLGLSLSLDGSAVRVTLGERTFDFDLGSPFVRYEGAAYPLVGAPYVARDTIFLPLHWLTDHVPRLLASRYHWDPWLARLDEVAIAPVATRPAPPVAAPPPTPAATAPTAPTAAPNPITGLRLAHTIVVDPGHGGIDPGNPGLTFPRGLTEKDITLGIGRLLRAELLRRGLSVVLTRATDTLIDLASRPLFCRADCDLFVSIHINSMPAGRRQTQVNGVETYFLSDAKTEDQKRVAQMENDALRFETRPVVEGPLGFILRDLQLNEYLRESARLAELVQNKVAVIHPGEDRGVQQGPFLVLAAARRPAILVEAGFATNRGDGAFLASAQGQHKIATAIAEGIVAYLLEFERKLAVGAGGGQAR